MKTKDDVTPAAVTGTIVVVVVVRSGTVNIT